MEVDSESGRWEPTTEDVENMAPEPLVEFQRDSRRGGSIRYHGGAISPGGSDREVGANQSGTASLASEGRDSLAFARGDREVGDRCKDTFYITTPIYYPDNRLHIGHTYTTVAADALARFHRLRGRDTFYLTGTDEHGQKIQQAARDRGVSPQVFLDEMVEWIKGLWGELGISYDRFIRTTDPDHVSVVQSIFARLHETGDIYPSSYYGWYCTPCESFWLENKLVEGACPDCGRAVSWVEEDAYFLRLTAYADRLLRYIEENPGFIQPDIRKNEMVSFLKSGLEDLCVSRKKDALQWGIQVPFDRDYVIYVWFDAVCNYITAIGYGDPAREAFFEKYWPAQVHLIGKEILRFHCIIWPIILMALDLPLPEQVFGHGWLTIGGEKISKSRGNVVDPLVLSEKYGRDAIRYFLLREIPFGADGRYTERALVDRINVDLANDLGNLLSRVTAMIDRYYEGCIPERPAGPSHLGEVAQEAIRRVEEAMESCLLSDALAGIWLLVSAANKYIEDMAPWKLGGIERDAVLYDLAESLRVLSILLSPFLVDAPVEMRRQLGLDEGTRPSSWKDVGWGGLPSGIAIDRGAPLFPRLDPEEVLGDVAEIEESTIDSEGEIPMIDYEHFSAMDLRTGTVVAAEEIEGADKLLKVMVDVGEEAPRQVVAGIAEAYGPDDLVGENVVVVANLKPARLFGVESQGMILSSEGPEGLNLIRAHDGVSPGSKVK